VGREPALQFVGEQQVGELGLPVGADPAVAAFPLQVIEVNVGADAVAHAADGDDPGTRDGQEPIKQQAGEREVTEMVGAELQLEAVLGGRLRRPHHARVVDQQVDAVVRGAQLVGRGAHGLQ
jgi:hypothetical protein